MNESTYQYKKTVSSWFSKQLWLKGQLKRTIEFSQPLNVVKERITQAFSEPITEYHGLLLPSYNYSASFSGNTINLEYSKTGKNGMSFDMTGCFSQDSNGTRLEMTVRDSLISYLPLFLIPFMFLANRSVSLMWPFIMIILPVIIIVHITWHRADAADDISRLLWKIVN